MMDTLGRLYETFFGAAELIAPQYVVAWVLLAWFFYLSRRETIGFFAWLFPKAIWLHKSTRSDIALFTIGRLISFFGLLSRFAATPAIAAWVAGLMPLALLGSNPPSPVVLALVLFLCQDFTVYWMHRAYHTITVIWPLHAVHHSAAVMTPITTYRQHPLSIVINTAIQSIVVGILFGVLIGVFDPDLPMATIIGANAFLVLANMTVANFHHSHIWISFGPVLERVFISPAQHQVHHSIERRHFDKNYGQTLAIWDWMFGTLYLTQQTERVTFGLEGKAEAPLMTQRLSQLLLDPVKRLIVR